MKWCENARESRRLSRYYIAFASRNLWSNAWPAKNNKQYQSEIYVTIVVYLETAVRYRHNRQLAIYHKGTFMSVAEGIFCRTTSVQCQVSSRHSVHVDTIVFSEHSSAYLNYPPTRRPSPPLPPPSSSSLFERRRIYCRHRRAHATNQANLLIAWHLYDSYKTMR